MILTIDAIREDKPGEKWQKLFEKNWPGYRDWFLREGHLARPGYMTSRKNLRASMPELLPIYEQLIELAGGGDLAARFLSLYCPPPYLVGCSQAIWQQEQPLLIRNYDYDPRLFEGVLLRTSWLRPVIAMSDCLWGCLDGINDAGFSAALAFGGRKKVGDGFGAPLIVRYLLEVCETTAQAKAILQRVRSHMPYNITILDRSGGYATAYLSPDRTTLFSDHRAITNYQEKIEWPEYATFTACVERKEFLQKKLAKSSYSAAQFSRDFLKAPLYNTDFEKGFGTLYTAIYNPAGLSVNFLWPEKSIEQSFSQFAEKTTVLNLKPTRATF